MCNVCCIQIETGNGEICSACNHLCHLECIEDTEDMTSCCLCKAAEDEQNEFQQDHDYNKHSQIDTVHSEALTEQVDDQIDTQVLINKPVRMYTTDISSNSNNIEKNSEKQGKCDENIQFLTSETR